MLKGESAASRELSPELIAKACEGRDQAQMGAVRLLETAVGGTRRSLDASGALGGVVTFEISSGAWSGRGAR